VSPGRSLTCREVLDFLLAFLENELDADTRFAFERHLAICVSCVAYLHSYQRTVELVRTAWSDETPAEDALPADLVAAVLAARGG
jgi:hypothetical protein